MVAIVGAAYLETHLKALVKRQLPGLNSDLSKKLFEPDRPLGNMGALIDMARALNVITNRGRNEAIKIARVRNRFAHNVEINDFDHPEVAKIIDDMDSYRGFKMAHDGLYDVDDKDMSRREVITSLIRDFCFSIERELSGPVSWAVGEEDLHVVPHPASPRKSRGRSRLPPEGLTNRLGQ